MENTVYNSQLNWASNDPKSMHSSKEKVIVLKKQVSGL